MTEQKKNSASDDKYKGAVKDAMEEWSRIDNMAPSILNAVKKDVDLRNGIKEIVAEGIREKEDIQKAISAVVDQNQTNKIYKIIKSGAIILVTAAITAVGTWLVTCNLPQDNSEITELRRQIEQLKAQQ